MSWTTSFACRASPGKYGCIGLLLDSWWMLTIQYYLSLWLVRRSGWKKGMLSPISVKLQSSPDGVELALFPIFSSDHRVYKLKFIVCLVYYYVLYSHRYLFVFVSSTHRSVRSSNERNVLPTNFSHSLFLSLRPFRSPLQSSSAWQNCRTELWFIGYVKCGGSLNCG